MYTRVYQGKGVPLPEDYHGTAFEKIEKIEEEPVQEAAAFAEEGRKDSAFFAEEREKELPPPPRERQEDAQAHDRAWRTDILLLSICALLVESEEVDNRLLALLLLLLLSPNT